MLTAAYVEINALALAILVLIFVNIRSSTEKYTYEHRLFFLLLFANAVILLLDTGMWVLNGQPGEAARIANMTVTTAYFCLNPFPCAVWFLMAHYYVFRDPRRSQKLFWPVSVPFVLVAAMSVISAFTGWFFYFDAKNVYHRGRLFFLMAGLCFSFLVIAQIMIVVHRRKIEWKRYMPIFVFSFPPLIGTLLQSLFYGLSLIWPAMAISILIMFFNFENDLLYRDPLTGLYNRRQLDRFLRTQLIRGGLTAGIMVDINHFKEINDRFGHSVGDRALLEAGRILSRSFSKNDLVCRYGGDEFVVLFGVRNEADLWNARERIRKNLARFSKWESAPFALDFSIGCDIYYKGEMNGKQFIRHIDSLMYQDKKRRKFGRAE